MFQFFKNDKIKQFDDALNQYNEKYETIISSWLLSAMVSDFKINITKGHVLDTCQSYTRSARSRIQKLQDLYANVSKLEPQTQEQVIQKEKCYIKINEQLINLHEFIGWLLVVRAAYSQGRLDGSHKAEEKPMD